VAATLEVAGEGRADAAATHDHHMHVADATPPRDGPAKGRWSGTDSLLEREYR
jgi:hypothetical protein